MPKLRIKASVLTEAFIVSQSQKTANARRIGQNPPTRRNIFKKRTIIRYNDIFPFFRLSEEVQNAPKINRRR